MSMKKAVLFAAAALSLVACGKTYLDEPVAQNSIGFNTWTNNLTKAATRTAGDSDFVDGDSFVVEGVKTIENTPSVVFDNVPVTKNGTDWKYDNTRYWDSKASAYAFYAVSSPNTTLSFGTEGKIVATEVTFSGEDNDILLANSVNVAPANFGKPVDFLFKHIGALVDLKVKKDAALNDATVAITGVSFEKIDGTAKFAVTGYSSNVPTVEWTNRDGNTSYNNNSGVVKVETLPNNVPTTATDLINKLVVIPQTLTNTKLLKISYEITDGAGNVNTFNNVEIQLNQFDKVDDTDNEDEFISTWEASKHYVYTLTISANAITFTADITDWTSVEGYHYLVK